MRLGNALRRWRLTARARLDASRQRASLELDLAPDLKLGRGIRIELAPRSCNRLTIGPGSQVGDRVLIRLDGGRVRIGDWVEIRRDCVFNVSGSLELEGRNLVSWSCSVHCDEAIQIKRMAVLSERVTVVDSSHHFTSPLEWMLDNVRTGPVEIGSNTWVAANATISRGVRIGDFCVVSANSLVVEDVPSGQVVAGVPAKVVRPVVLPWST